MILASSNVTTPPAFVGGSSLWCSQRSQLLTVPRPKLNSELAMKHHASGESSASLPSASAMYAYKSSLTTCVDASK